MNFPSTSRIYGLFALLCCIWGSTWLVIREGLQDLPPFTSAAMRFSLAAFLMIFVVHYFRHREGGIAPAPWLWLSVGFCNFACFYGIIYWCETLLPSGLVAVLWGVFPLLMAASGHFFLSGEKLHPRQWLGFMIGFIGIMSLFLTDIKNFGPHGFPAALVLLLSPVVSVIGTTLLKRFGTHTNSLLVNRNAMAVGAGLLWLVASIYEPEQPLRWTWTATLSILYLAVMGTVVTFAIYFWLMRFAPAYRLSLISYVVPMLALGLGWVVGNEPVTFHTLLGACLTLAGIALVVAKPSRSK